MSVQVFVTPANMMPTFDVFAQGFQTGHLADGAGTVCNVDFTDTTSASPLAFTYADAIDPQGINTAECRVRAVAVCCQPTPQARRMPGSGKRKSAFPPQKTHSQLKVNPKAKKA